MSSTADLRSSWVASQVLPRGSGLIQEFGDHNELPGIVEPDIVAPIFFDVIERLKCVNEGSEVELVHVCLLSPDGCLIRSRPHDDTHNEIANT